MISTRRVTPLLASFLLLFLTACQEDSRRVDPAAIDVGPSMSHVPAWQDNPILVEEGLESEFFFLPPIDTEEDHISDLDADALDALTLEVCRTGDIGDWNANPDDFDDFERTCPEEKVLGRWNSTDPIFGQTLSVSSSSFQVVLKFNQFPEEELPLNVVHLARVIIGDPDKIDPDDGPKAGWVPGFFRFEFVENASDQTFDEDPAKLRVGDLPTKFFLGEKATSLLVCGDADVACTFEVFQHSENAEENETQDICFPINDCDLEAGLAAGLEIDPDALAEVAGENGGASLVVCKEIDLSENPNPLGVGLPQVPQFVDCGFTPSFGTLEENTFSIELCILSGTEDELSFVAGHLREKDGVVEFLAEFSDPEGIFSAGNCEGFDPVAANGGILDRIRYAALNRVLRPMARFLGPEPLRAYDRTRWSSASDSPFGPVLRLDVLANQGPDATELSGETVTASVCVATHHLPDPNEPAVAPGTDNQVDILFEVITGGGTIVGGDEPTEKTKTVRTALREKTEDDECGPTDGGVPPQIAEASVEWTLSDVGELNELKASIPGDFAEVSVNMGEPTIVPLEGEENTLSHTFGTVTLQSLAMCPTPNSSGPYTAFDEYGQRGFYIDASATGLDIAGGKLHAVEINLSSNNKSAGGLAGTYELELSARRGTYDPAQEFALGTATASVNLDGDPPEMKPVRFVFDEPIDLLSGADQEVAFVGRIVEAPKKNARLWFLVPDLEKIDGFPQSGDPECTGAIVTNGTTFTTPLDTDRRQGMYIDIVGETGNQ